MQVIFMAECLVGSVDDLVRGKCKTIVMFHPIGTRKQLLDWFSFGSPHPVHVGVVDVDVPFEEWLDYKHASAFKPKYVCNDYGVKAWQQARAFKKSFEEVHELRIQLAAPVVPRRSLSI